jgi:hypothetical protein
MGCFPKPGNLVRLAFHGVIRRLTGIAPEAYRPSKKADRYENEWDQYPL